MSATDPVRLEYGKSQILTSARLSRRPWVGKLLYGIFGYTNLGNWARSQVVIRLLNQLPLSRFTRILDLGAGMGEFSFMLAQALPQAQITALEIAPERVDALRKGVERGGFTNVRVHPGLVETLPPGEEYDLIFAIDVFEHIAPEQMPFGACLDRLKEGGHLLVKIPNRVQRTILPERLFEEHESWLEEEHPGQVYDLGGLEDRFVSEGFTVVHSSTSDGLLARLGWEIAYLAKRGGPVPQLAFLPLCKTFVCLDRLTGTEKHSGNAIQVIGQKTATERVGKAVHSLLSAEKA